MAALKHQPQNAVINEFLTHAKYPSNALQTSAGIHTSIHIGTGFVAQILELAPA